MAASTLDVLDRHSVMLSEPIKPQKHRTVDTTLNYYDDPGDGTPPAPVLVGG